MSKLKEEFEADSEFTHFFSKSLKYGNDLKIETLNVANFCHGKEGYFGQFIETLIANTNLTRLKLVESKAPNPDEIDAFAKILVMSRSLTYCEIDASSKFITRLIEDLGSNTTLKSLKLSYFDIDLKETKSLSEWLKTNTTLKFLNLRNNKIDSERAKVLVEALKTNTTLKILSLSENEIGPTGAIILAKYLQTNTTLENLDVYHNNIGLKGAIEIAEALKTNTTLKILSLGYNKTGPTGAIALAKYLQTNTTLKSLFLAYNNIGSEGATAFAKMLKQNHSLTKLDLGNNHIGSEALNVIDLKGLKAIASSLIVNKSLVYLNIDENGFQRINAGYHETVTEAYKKALNSNFHLRGFFYDTKLDPSKSLPPLRTRNEEIFDRAKRVIKKIGEGDNITIEGVGSKAGFICKFIQEAPQTVFLEVFSPEKVLSYLSKVHTFICKYFFSISGVCTKPIDFGLPPDMWSYLLKNYLKLGDISWEHANKAPSQDTPPPQDTPLHVEEMGLAGADGAPSSTLNVENDCSELS